MGAWIAEHWFTVLQTLGIAGGLVFTAISLRIDAKVRRIGNLLTLTAHHRDIWTQVYRREELVRVLQSDVDLNTAPVTAEERLFVTLLVHHLNAAYQASRAGLFVRPEGLARDAAAFFSLPIPREIWRTLRPYQDRRFSRFVDGVLARFGDMPPGNRQKNATANATALK